MQAHPLSLGLNVSVTDVCRSCMINCCCPSCFPAFCSMCAGIVSVTLNNNKGVNELFIIYCSFSHPIEPAMYRLERILDVMHRPCSEWWGFPLAVGPCLMCPQLASEFLGFFSVLCHTSVVPVLLLVLRDMTHLNVPKKKKKQAVEVWPQHSSFTPIGLTALTLIKVSS